MILLSPPAKKRQNFFGVFLQFQIGADMQERKITGLENGIHMEKLPPGILVIKRPETPAQLRQECGPQMYVSSTAALKPACALSGCSRPAMCRTGWY